MNLHCNMFLVCRVHVELIVCMCFVICVFVVCSLHKDKNACNISCGCVFLPGRLHVWYFTLATISPMKTRVKRISITYQYHSRSPFEPSPPRSTSNCIIVHTIRADKSELHTDNSNNLNSLESTYN